MPGQEGGGHRSRERKMTLRDISRVNFQECDSDERGSENHTMVPG